MDLKEAGFVVMATTLTLSPGVTISQVVLHYQGSWFSLMNNNKNYKFSDKKNPKYDKN